MESDRGMNHICVECGNISAVKDRRRRSFGSWLKKKSWQEYKVSGSRNRQPEKQVKCCHDTDCDESMMKKSLTTLKNGTLEEYKETFRKKMKASEWAFDRTKEAFEQVAQDEA